MYLYRISNKRFTCSLEFNKDSIVIQASPLVKWMKNKSYQFVKEFCQGKQWGLERVTKDD
jgi:hypothetical protein